MKNTQWYKDAVIYQIYPKSFCDTNNDGLGDIRGIISKLDYLKELGINCVWLSPVYDSPQKDNGYDISDYRKIYPPFGTMDDFKEMLQKMHERGIRLVMDLVVNHTSDQCEWFKEAIKGKDNPYRNYYIIRKGKGKNGKKPPNNWSGFFGEGAWSRIGETEDWYLHLFAKEQPDLNWENTKVREEVKSILKFWLDMGVDGFRCDVITLISKKQDFKSRFPTIALCGKDAFVNGPRLHEYLQELNRDVLSNYDCMTVGETVLSSLDEAKLLVKPERNELSMVFNFDHTDVDNYFGIKNIYRKFKLKRLRKVVKHWQHGMFNEGWNSLFIENHDQRRSVGRFGTSDDKYRVESAKMLGTTYFFLQGTPFIYEGQEIGMTNGHFKSLDEIVDIETHNMDELAKKNILLRRIIRKSMFDVSRDNPRIPVSWDDSEYAGFSKVKPWIRVNKNKDTINVKKALEDKDSIFYYFQNLIKIRKGNEIIKNGTYEDISKGNKVFAYKRFFENKEYLVISNFTSKELKYSLLNKLDGYKLVTSNYKENGLTLKPYETRLYYKG